MGGKKSRQKGHAFERFLAQVYRDMGYEKCITSRQGSKLVDSTKIDLMHIPYNLQAKSGYNKRRPKYEVLYYQSKDLIKEKFPEQEAKRMLEKPFILVHKLDGGGPSHPELIQWTFDHNTAVKILKENYQIKQEIEEMKKYIKSIERGEIPS